MHRRIVPLIGLAAIAMVTYLSLFSVAGSIPGGPAWDGGSTRTLAQASPAAMPDAVVGNLSITILDSERGDGFVYSIRQVHNDGYITWHNDSTATHELEITSQGKVMSNVQLEPNESYSMRLLAAGPVHWKCTTHGEGGTL